MTGISVEVQKKVLADYLQTFNIKVSKRERNKFNKFFPEFESSLIIGDPVTLRKVGCFFLLRWGRQKYRLENSYDLIENYFGNKEDEDRGGMGLWYNLQSRFLIIYHHKFTLSNKLLPDIISHIVMRRSQAGMPTLVLTEEEIPLVTSVFIGIKKPIKKFLEESSDDVNDKGVF